jgi:hypothetical protein
MPVKRIDAFRTGDPGRRTVPFGPYKIHAPLPEVIASSTTGVVIKESVFPFENQAEIIQEGPDPRSVLNLSLTLQLVKWT